jgi:RNA recognition motif-containing protein
MLVCGLPRALQSSVQLLKKGSFNRCRNSGLACVTITCSGDVQHCCNLMDGKQIYGRPMIVRKDKFEADDPAYDSTTAVAAVPAAAAAAALQAPAAGSAVAAVQHVKGAAAKAKQLAVVPSQCAAAAAATAAGGGSPNSSRWTANSVRFVG